jgi:hypothetical protein
MRHFHNAFVCSIMLAFLAGFMPMTANGQTSSTEDEIDFRFYGFVKLEAIYDNTELAKGDWLLYARPDGTLASRQNAYTMNARHTRLGVDITGITLGENGKIKSVAEVDFAGGYPNSSTAARQPNLRLRHAWVAIVYPEWEARFGQDWALIAGPFPNTTSFVVGAGKGNLWMRYPQIKFTVKQEKFNWAVSLNRPMAGNTKYEDFAGGDFDPVGDGELSGLPWIMSRLWIPMGASMFSVSGHVGKERMLDLSDVAHDKNSASLNADLVVSANPVTFTVRGFVGANLNSFFGGVFQGANKYQTGVHNIHTRGGWAQMVAKFDSKWSGTIGCGMDNPYDSDLNAGQRCRNDWVFTNLTCSINKNLSFMLEYDYLKTHYMADDAGVNHRIQFVNYFKF